MEPKLPIGPLNRTNNSYQSEITDDISACEILESGFSITSEMRKLFSGSFSDYRKLLDIANLVSILINSYDMNQIIRS